MTPNRPSRLRTAAFADNADRQRLGNLRLGLLRLHKTLLDAERIAYERSHGRVSNHRMLQLAIGDEWFSWLHPLSELVVQIDEALKADEPVTAEVAKPLLDQARDLLTSSEDNRFTQQYRQALQLEPDVVLSHVAMTKFLSEAAS
ncbi:hypothetical protein H6F67_08095 [Microcoleus sp. FACHB-1515]|uniref:hypothetical protein n=1 Tax=Cyanophyceae TaxID=3028117 RepID=UPI001686B347|nr:hypothetical protein [Microcoleus sp. FACHB-1515]MBD2089813.1 hypothetical protein [Microcoleus sp. FACHB-1515]